MKATLILDGRTESSGAPLVCHNERLADPLDEYVRAIQAIAKKRGKAEADHAEIARLEFLGGMYTNGNGPMLPAWNIIRCLVGEGDLVTTAPLEHRTKAPVRAGRFSPRPGPAVRGVSRPGLARLVWAWLPFPRRV